MLKARKKITHKEITKDKLVTAYFESREWINKAENKKKIYTVVGIIAVFVIIAFFYVNNKKAKNEEQRSSSRQLLRSMMPENTRKQ